MPNRPLVLKYALEGEVHEHFHVGVAEVVIIERFQSLPGAVANAGNSQRAFLDEVRGRFKVLQKRLPNLTPHCFEVRPDERM